LNLVDTAIDLVDGSYNARIIAGRGLDRGLHIFDAAIVAAAGDLAKFIRRHRLKAA
jgi:hypothetical protein